MGLLKVLRTQADRTAEEASTEEMKGFRRELKVLRDAQGKSEAAISTI